MTLFLTLYKDNLDGPMFLALPGWTLHSRPADYVNGDETSLHWIQYIYDCASLRDSCFVVNVSTYTYVYIASHIPITF